MQSQNKLIIEWDESLSIIPETKQLFYLAYESVLQVVGVDKLYQTNLLIVDDEGIRQLNHEYRGKDAVTDVLSFPGYSPGEKPDFDHRTGCYELGDIAISLPRARAQAEEYGHSLDRELAFLLIHGVLHCLGYDHEQGPDADSNMRQLQRESFAVMVDRQEREKDLEQQLVHCAIAVKEHAYAPYSGFRVGACLLSEDGIMYTGCNVENVSFGATICAERSAVVNAIAQGCRDFQLIAIASDAEDFVLPCGICRQVLHEFSPMLEVLCVNGQGAYRKYKLSELLPAPFEK